MANSYDESGLHSDTKVKEPLPANSPLLCFCVILFCFPEMQWFMHHGRRLFSSCLALPQWESRSCATKVFAFGIIRDLAMWRTCHGLQECAELWNCSTVIWTWEQWYTSWEQTGKVEYTAGIDTTASFGGQQQRYKTTWTLCSTLDITILIPDGCQCIFPGEKR